MQKIEKGATYLDKLCHRLYDEPKGRGYQVDGKCRRCGGSLMTYYCEDRLNLIACEKCGTLALTKSVAPQVAANLTLRNPTLALPNEPLTQADLDSMDYDKVWIDYGDDGEWALVVNGRIYCLAVLEGAGFEDILREELGGETLDRPSGDYTVYRRPPEGDVSDVR